MAYQKEGPRFREFVVLVRHFTDRLKHDFFGVGEGDASGSIATALALLLAYGICVAAFLIMAFAFKLNQAAMDPHIEALLSARDVLTASTLALTGAYFVFLWDNLFPDRSDCHILLAQPISPGMLLGAKLVAIVGFLVTFTLAMHSLCLVVLPLVDTSAGGRSWLLGIPVYLISITAAMVTAFFSLAAFIALLLLILPYRAFQWLKPALQFSVFVAFLGQMFFSPPIQQLRAPAGAPLSEFALWWPSFWFVGLADWMSDGFLPHGSALAQRAVLALAISTLLGIGAILLAYPKAVRYSMEETDFACRRRPRFLFSEHWMQPWLGDDPPALALGLYSLKVLLRDARSRAMFLLYAGLASAYSLHQVSVLLASPDYANDGMPQVYLLPIPLVLVVFALLAIRGLCATPISLPASWIFWLVDWGDARRVRKALRGVMLAVVVFPVGLLCLAFHAWAWNSWLACTHTVFLILMSLIATEWILRKIGTVPFTRPVAEHQSRLRVMFGIYVLMFALLTFVTAHLEFALLGSPGAFVLFLLFGGGVWLLLHYRNSSCRAPDVPALGKTETLLLGLDLSS